MHAQQMQDDNMTSPSGNQPLFLQTATALLALGLSPVLLDGKKPIFDNFTNYMAGPAHQSEMEMPENHRPLRYGPGQLELWQETYPRANVGMLTRDRPCIDVDDETAWEIIKDLVPRTPHFKQGQRGGTFIYSHDPADPVLRSRGHINRFTKKMVLEILADGRQTVLPPSIHPDTGQPYQWSKTPWGDPPTPLNDTVPPTISQRQVDAIEERLRAHGLIKQKVERQAGLGRELREDEKHRYAVYLQPKLTERLETVRTAAEGGRQDALNGAVFALARWVRAGFIAEEWLEDQMRRACGADGNRYIISDGEKAFTRQFEKALDEGWAEELPDLDAGRLAGMGAAPLGHGSAPAASGMPLGPNDTAALPPLVSLSMVSELSKPEEPLEWTVPGWIPHAQVSLVYGDGGTGKTTLLQQLAVCASQGKPWLGMPTTKRKVLFISGEDEAKALKAQARPIAAWFGQPEVLDIVSLVEDKESLHPFIVLEDAAGVAQPQPMFWRIVNLIKAGGHDMVIFDPVAAIFGGNQNDPVAVYSFVNLLRRYIALELNCTVIIAAHPSQDGMKTGRGTSGTVAWNNACRSRLYLSAGDNTEDRAFRVLSLPKANRGDQQGATINLRWGSGWFNHGATETVAEIGDACAAFLNGLNATISAGVNVGLSVCASNYAPKVLARRAECKGFTKNDLEQAMHELSKMGQIHQVETGPKSKPRVYLYPVPSPKSSEEEAGTS